MNTFRSVFTRQPLLSVSPWPIMRLINTESLPNAKKTSTETKKSAEKMLTASTPKKLSMFYQKSIKTVEKQLNEKFEKDIFATLKNMLNTHPSSYDHRLECFADFDPENHFQDSAMIQFRADVDILNGKLTFNSSPRFNSILEKDLSDSDQKMIESLFKLAWGKPFKNNLTGTLLIRQLTFDRFLPEYCTHKHRDIDFVTGPCRVMVMEVDSKNVAVETTVWTDSGEKIREGSLLTLMENQEHSVTIKQIKPDEEAHRTVLVIRLQESL